VDSCYRLISEEWLLSDTASDSEPLAHSSTTGTPALSEGLGLFLSGCASPGLADSVLFAHLVAVATSRTDRRGLARIQHDYPRLYRYFVHLCQEYFHVKSHVSHNELLLQGNSALYQCVLASHNMATQDALSAVAESVFVKLVFGEKRSAPASPGAAGGGAAAVKRPLMQRGAHLVPHLNESTRWSHVQLLKSKYSFDLPSVLRSLLLGAEQEQGRDKGSPAGQAENYIGLRCLLFSGFVIGSFAKSVIDISRGSR
jgi:hypothetical protein